jgi:DNA-binding transcriptional LysR family regulator
LQAPQVAALLAYGHAASFFLLHVIVPLVNDLCRQFSYIELELNSSEDILDLVEQRTDVAIRIGTLHDATLHARLVLGPRRGARTRRLGAGCHPSRQRKRHGIITAL